MREMSFYSSATAPTRSASSSAGGAGGRATPCRRLRTLAAGRVVVMGIVVRMRVMWAWAGPEGSILRIILILRIIIIPRHTITNKMTLFMQVSALSISSLFNTFQFSLLINDFNSINTFKTLNNY